MCPSVFQNELAPPSFHLAESTGEHLGEPCLQPGVDLRLLNDAEGTVSTRIV
jgi:hypothetical protein